MERCRRRSASQSAIGAGHTVPVDPAWHWAKQSLSIGVVRWSGMGNYDSVDFFTDESLIEDPYPYFEHLRSKCPVVAMPHYGVVAVSGYEEATEVYRNIDTFSSCNSVVGPFATFPVPLEGDDVGAIIDRHRDQLPMNEHMVTMDPPMHTRERALLMRLLTPKRLKENEEFIGASSTSSSTSSSVPAAASSSVPTPSRSPCW